MSADTMVPDYGNPQSLNRYSYGYDNPVRYNDLSGHYACEDAYGDCKPRPPSLLTPLEPPEEDRILFGGDVLALVEPAGVSDNYTLQAYSTAATSLDVLDFSVTLSYGVAYLGVEAIAVVFPEPFAEVAVYEVAGAVWKRGISPALNFVDFAAVNLVAASDIEAGRTKPSTSVSGKEYLYGGTDTAVSITTFALSDIPTGEFASSYLTAMAGDAAQVIYDFMRLTERWPGTSIRVRNPSDLLFAEEK